MNLARRWEIEEFAFFWGRFCHVGDDRIYDLIQQIGLTA